MSTQNFLFLTENVEPQHQVETVSLAEANMLLAECYEGSAILNEALIKAEFAIFNESKLLSEDAAEEKKQGFFSKAKDRIVATAKTIWGKLVKVYNSIMDRAKGFLASFKAKKNAVLIISKAAADALPKLQQFVMTAAKAVGDDKGVVENAKKGFDEAYQAIGGKATGSDGKVKIKDANKLAGMMTSVSGGAKMAAAKLKAEIDSLSGAKSDQADRLAALRRAQGHSLTVATMASKVASMIVNQAKIGSGE
ncbi:hypothetical protein [Proteus mirabilis]|uniref:hypothetical protein n=1 Tax=Proteus mirabilis TaxID=584 RepID=UPI0034D4F514